MVTVAKADEKALIQVALNLRLEDYREVQRATGLPPSASILKTLDLPGDVLVAYLGEVSPSSRPFCAFGCYQGVVWLLCTDEVQKAKLSTFRCARLFLGEWLNRYGRLENLADCQNTLHLAWIKALGFTFGSQVKHRGHLFQHFYMEKDVCVNRLPSS